MIDEVVSEARNRIGRAKGYGGCARCGGTWDYTPRHATKYSETNSCFPLCETCWSALMIDERLPYYAHLVGRWACESPAHSIDALAKWPAIEAAVRAGL